MVRRTSPVVEALEERTLLTSLSYSLTTNQFVYQVGQPIELSVTSKLGQSVPTSGVLKNVSVSKVAVKLQIVPRRKR